MAAQLKNIDACVFDAYGTLFDVASSARSCAEELGEQWQDLSALWRQKQLEYTWLRSLMGRFSDFWNVTGDALDYAMEALKIDNPMLRARLMELYLGLEPYPEVKQTLQQLKDMGKKTAILSNGSRPMLTSAVRKSGLNDLLDAVYSVDDLQIYKTHPSTYQMAVDDLGVEAGRISFQSSNAWDAAGATAFGFQVAWVNRFNQPEEKLGVSPKFEIKSLDQLPPLMED